MNGSCENHPFEVGEDLCDQCGWEFCNECLVYPRGPKKPPLCVSCAVAASGVRSTARKRPARSKREIKRLRKERAKERGGKTTAQPPAGVSAAMDWESIGAFGAGNDRPAAEVVESGEAPVESYEPTAAPWSQGGGSEDGDGFNVLRPAFNDELSRTS